MRNLLILTLSTSAALIAPINTAAAKDCPPLKVAEIMVQDPDGKIKLRTDPQYEEQKIPGAQGRNVIVQRGKPLAVIKETLPQFNQSENLCYYPVAFKDGEEHGNDVIPGVLSYEPYWISAKGIKDYEALINTSPATRPLNSQSKAIKKPIFNINFLLFQILAWLIIPALMIAVLILVFLAEKKDICAVSIEA
jgi:hypothetical protein